MEFPDRDVALKWVGMTVVDRDGAEIGACTAVFTDDANLVTEWVRTERSGVAVLLPAVGAAEVGGNVQVVAVRRDDVDTAPAAGGPELISAEEQVALYRHYGIPHSRDASSTVLPDDQPAEGGVSSGVPSGVSEDASARAYADGQDATALAQAGSGTGPDAAALTQPGSDAGQDQPTESRSPSGGRRKVLVAGSVAGLGSVLGVVLGKALVRRRRPPTRRERLVRRGRAASGAVSSGAGRLAASAVPVLEVTRRAVLGHPRSGAAAAAVALLAATVRRRRNREEPDAAVPDAAVPVAAVSGRRTGEQSDAAVRRWRRTREQPDA